MREIDGYFGGRVGRLVTDGHKWEVPGADVVLVVDCSAVLDLRPVGLVVNDSIPLTLAAKAIVDRLGSVPKFPVAALR